jgi:hypothetical protein
MSTALIAFGSAVLGALAGGLAAASGGDWVQRRQLRRTARFHMYGDLLPQWKPLLRPPVRGSSFSDEVSPHRTLADLRRSAVLAGQKECDMVAAMNEAWDAYRAPLTQQEQVSAQRRTRQDIRAGPSTP